MKGMNRGFSCRGWKSESTGSSLEMKKMLTMDQTPTARGQSLICSSAVWTTRCEQAPSVQVFGVRDSVSKVKGLQHVKQSLVHRRRRVDQKQVGTTKKFTWFKLSRYAGYQRAEFISGDVSGRVLRTLWSHPSRRASTDAPILYFYCVRQTTGSSTCKKSFFSS